MKKTIIILLCLFAVVAMHAQFNVIPLNVDDVLPETQWKGRWIGIDRLLPGEDMQNKTRVNARYLRTEFTLQDKPIRSAKAYVAAMGYYELYVNGKRIGGRDVLTPVQTDSRKSIIYNTLDITKEMKPLPLPSRGREFNAESKAAVGVILGNGRTVPMRYAKHQKCPFFGFPKCRIEIIVKYEDGTSQRISTDEKTWKMTADGPIRSNNEYDGEVYDARKDLGNWSMAGYDDSAWMQGERAELPIATLYPQTAPNQQWQYLTEIDASIPRPSFIYNKVGECVVDLHQNIAGWITLKVRGKEGDTIRIKYAERLNADSTIYTANLRDAETEDVYICNGKEDGTTPWHPTFVYHGGRYVRITGMPDITEQDIEVCVVSDAMRDIGSFTCSNTMLNTIYRNAWWGIKDNYHGFPVDCPQRNERQPWLGDRTVGSLGESYLFDNEMMYERWMRDICEAQRYDGAIPDVAPSFWNYYTDDVTWPACLPFTCDMLYRQFGNENAIRNSYPYIKKWIAHVMEAYSKDGLITKDKYGDWCMPPEKPELIHSEDPTRKTDGTLLASAYMIQCLKLAHDFATLQGFSDEARDYEQKAKAMTEAFNARFLKVKKGTSPEPGHPLFPDSIFYDNNTATANVLALAFDIVPAEYKKDVLNNVVENIIVKNNGHVSCGVIGISYLLRTLTENGRGDVAYLIATNKTYPSWGYMAEHGATTIWELWNGDTANPAMNSGNHVMLLGDLLTWCYQCLGGIKNAPGSVAYKKLEMKPDFSIQDLDSVDCSYATRQGIVHSKWKKTLEKLHWEVLLPKGVTAECYLPDGTVRNIGEGLTTMDCSIPFGRNLTNADKQDNQKVVDDEFIYDQSQYPEVHSHSIVELDNGDLLVTYFGGTKERNPDVCIYVQRKDAPSSALPREGALSRGGVTCGESEWSEPLLVADGVFSGEPPQGAPGEQKEQYVAADKGPCRTTSPSEGGGGALRTACWNPVLYQMPDGEVWLFFKIGRNVKDWTGWLCKSKDGGRTWTEKEPLPEGFLGPIKNKPELINGKLICPSSTESDGWQLHFEIYDIATGQWSRTAPTNRKDVLAIQPAILVHGSLPTGEGGGRGPVLQAVARTRPTKEQREGTDTTRGKIATCWSYDGGLTWGETSLLDVPNNQSGIDAVTLQKPVTVKCSDGKKYKGMRHVMIYNNFGTLPGTNKGPRTPLSLAVSADGVTWHHWLTLEDSPISQYSYPAIIQGRDGSLHCVYTWRRQRSAYKRVIF